jgi:hypothetical protein
LAASAPRAVSVATVVGTASPPASDVVVRGIDIFFLPFAMLWLPDRTRSYGVAGNGKGADISFGVGFWRIQPTVGTSMFNSQ